MRALHKRDFLLPLALLALSVVPLLGGVVRLLSLGEPTTADSARFVAAPVPVVLHIIAAALYALLGAFQFPPAFRGRWPLWHRRAGRVLVVAGLIGAVTGVWMTLAYEIPPGMQGPLLLVGRVLVGTAMAAALVLGWRAIVQRRVLAHEAWMVRAYALGQGAGTQVLVLGPWMVVTGQSEGFTRDVLMLVAWGINVAVGELIIHRRRKQLPVRAPAAALSASHA